MNKKILSTIIIMTIGMSLVACGNKTTSRKTSVESKETTTMSISESNAETKNVTTIEIATESAIISTETATTVITEQSAITNTVTPASVKTETPINNTPANTIIDTPVVAHVHDWQPHYVTVHVSNAYDEPIYQETPVYGYHRIASTGEDLDVLYQQYLNNGGNKDTDFVTWARMINSYTSWYPQQVQTGTKTEITGYTHHDAVDNTYIDYYYCTGCSETKPAK